MFQIPSLADLLARARAAFRTYLPGTDAWSWPNNIYASAKVIAGMAFEVFGFASYISKMIFASTAPDLETLQLHGAEFGLPLLPAAPASGKVTFTSSTAITVDTGAQLQRVDGTTYLVTAGGTLSIPGTLILPVTCSANGAIANAVEGTPLTVASGLTGTATVAVGPGDLALGSDVEDKESYRQRILFRKRNPPHGGAPSDYVIWGRQAAGVTRVFVERLYAGPGTVRVFIFMDGGFPDGIPDSTAVAAVRDYIATVQPASAVVVVAAPVPRTVDITIDNLVPDTTDMRNAIVAEIKAAFLRKGRVAGQDTQHGGMPYLATPAKFQHEWVVQAISNTAGVESYDLITPTADTVLQVGETAVPGTISFV
ncbi:baseplate J/gp47 family protein [Bradyrhizobium cenepequi]